MHGQDDGDLRFAQLVIVDLQHLVRDLRHQLENERVVNAELARSLSECHEQVEEVENGVFSGYVSQAASNAPSALRALGLRDEPRERRQNRGLAAGRAQRRAGARYLSELAAADWGLWKTATMIAERADAFARSLEGFQRVQLVHDQVRRLLGALEDVPKTSGWRLRARIGERKRWYFDACGFTPTNAGLIAL
jgi:hypothetical protein